MSIAPRIVLATTDTEIAACHPVMHQLRPHIAASTFVERVRRMQATGYHLAYLTDGAEVAAVAGFRLLDQLVADRVLYVDDLVTDAGRRAQGFGRHLLTWLSNHARERGCQFVDLDSGVWRPDAHRFYFREGLTILGFHFRTPALDGARVDATGPKPAPPPNASAGT